MKFKDYLLKEIQDAPSSFTRWHKYYEISDAITKAKEWQSEIEKELKNGKISKDFIDKIAKDVLDKRNFKLYQKDFNEMIPFLSTGFGIEQDDIKQ